MKKIKFYILAISVLSMSNGIFPVSSPNARGGDSVLPSYDRKNKVQKKNLGVQTEGKKSPAKNISSGNKLEQNDDSIVKNTERKRKERSRQKTYFDLANKLLRDGKTDEALKYFEKAAEFSGPYDRKITTTLISLYAQKKKIQKAKKLALSFPEISQRAEALYILARALELRDADTSIEIYSEIFSSYPNNRYAAKSLLNCAYLFLAQKKYFSAQENVIKLIEKYQHPYYAVLSQAYYFAGIMYSSPGPIFDPDKAIKCFSAFTKSNYSKRYDFKKSFWKDAAIKELHFIGE